MRWAEGVCLLIRWSASSQSSSSSSSQRPPCIPACVPCPHPQPPLPPSPPPHHPKASGFTRTKRIIDREDEYRRRRLNRALSPERNDAFVMGDKTPDARVRTYGDVMREAALARERDNTLRNIEAKKRAEAEAAEAAAAAGDGAAAGGGDAAAAAAAAGEKRKNRWDAGTEGGEA
jgi:splicing factor 3B subunit 1